MTRNTYETIRAYMTKMMDNSAHDTLHIYRVLHQALRIAEAYTLDRDVLIASCLLHDIGRRAQFEDPGKCHAVEGGKLAYAYLKQLGWEEERCTHVRDCIASHRFRGGDQPQSLEAKILFDADKLDVTGALGIARTLQYEGQVGEPIYCVDERFQTRNGLGENCPDSFFREYHVKLIKLYDHFYTPEAAAIAQKRKALTESFYAALLEEGAIGGLEQQLTCLEQDK